MQGHSKTATSHHRCLLPTMVKQLRICLQNCDQGSDSWAIPRVGSDCGRSAGCLRLRQSSTNSDPTRRGRDLSATPTSETGKTECRLHPSPEGSCSGLARRRAGHKPPRSQSCLFTSNGCYPGSHRRDLWKPERCSIPIAQTLLRRSMQTDVGSELGPQLPVLSSLWSDFGLR